MFEVIYMIAPRLGKWSYIVWHTWHPTLTTTYVKHKGGQQRTLGSICSPVLTMVQISYPIIYHTIFTYMKYWNKSFKPSISESMFMLVRTVIMIHILSTELCILIVLGLDALYTELWCNIGKTKVQNKNDIIIHVCNTNNQLEYK